MAMIRALLAAFSFLTRLPVTVAGVTDRDLGRSVGFFPLVGLALGVAIAGAAYGVRGHVSPPLAAVVLVALLAAFTGALHLDGLSDLFDGVVGGQGQRERTLQIMRDSRIGAAGAVALVLVLAAKIAAVSTLLEAGNFRALVAFPVVARWVVTPQIVLFPVCHPQGLASTFHGHARARELVVAAVGMAAVAVAVGPAIARALVAALVVSLTIALWSRRRLGGLTGDIYGATIELAEAAALVAAAVR